ncbi:unnamed protein product, partial [marine sediment metagenome]
ARIIQPDLEPVPSEITDPKIQRILIRDSRNRIRGGLLRPISGTLARQIRYEFVLKNENDSTYELIFPKADAILIENPDIVSELNQHYYTGTLEAAKKLHLDTAKKIKRLIKEGLDLDETPNEQLEDTIPSLD